MKFGLQCLQQLPKPEDLDAWREGDEERSVQELIDQIAFADKLGFDYAFAVEHHFLEEYSHCSAPEVILSAAAARTERIRLGHGIIHMPPKQNHPARVAERVATLDLVSHGRVEFGTGEGSTVAELMGFGTTQAEKREAWEEATRECLRMMSMTPYPGYQGTHFSMPERNIIPKPKQKPHPPVWVATSRRETAMMAAHMGIGALGFGFETPEEAQERVERYYELIRECRRPIGLAMNPALVSVGNMHCADTNERAIEQGLPGAQFFGLSIGWTLGEVKWGRDHIYREYLRRTASGSAEAQAAALELEPEGESARSLYRAARRGLFIGSPDYIRENLRRYEAAHVDAVFFLVQVSNRSHDMILDSMERFAKEVMPEFKDRHHLHQKWREQQLDGVKFPINSTI